MDTIEGGTMECKPISEVQPGDSTPSGIVYTSEPAEQPDGTWSIMIRYPSGRYQIADFASGDVSSDVPS